MSINEKNVGEIARQLGLSSGKGVSKAQIDYLSSKNDGQEFGQFFFYTAGLDVHNL